MRENKYIPLVPQVSKRSLYSGHTHARITRPPSTSSMARDLKRGCEGADGATAVDRAGARPTAGTGPRHTMGLCVHPALPWSGAGQAGIWGQARNSFPWRGPPHPLPGCAALWGVGGQAPPSPLVTQAVEWRHARWQALGNRDSWVQSLAWTTHSPVRHFTPIV